MNQLDHLISHFGRVGGDGVVMAFAQVIKSRLNELLKSLEKVLTVTEEGT